MYSETLSPRSLRLYWEVRFAPDNAEGVTGAKILTTFPFSGITFSSLITWGKRLTQRTKSGDAGVLTCGPHSCGWGVGGSWTWRVGGTRELHVLLPGAVGPRFLLSGDVCACAWRRDPSFRGRGILTRPRGERGGRLTFPCNRITALPELQAAWSQ